MTDRTDAAFVDHLWDAHVAADDETPMWDSPLEQIGRWFTSSSEATASIVDRMTSLGAEANRRAADADGLAPTLMTAGDAAALLAAHLDTYVERELPHPELGLHSHLFWAVNNYPLATRDHGEQYLDKLAALPGVIDEFVARLGEAAAGGRAPLARHTARAVEKLDEHLGSDLGDDPLLRQATPSELDDASADAWRTRLADVVRDAVRPGLATLRTTLSEVCLPAGADDDHPGIGHQPGGEETYLGLLHGYTARGATPRQIHDTGLEQLERLDDEFRTLGASAFGLTDAAAIRSRLRDDTSLSYTTADEVVAAATELHARAQELAPSWFLRTPVSPCEIRATEHGSLAFYSSPSKDGTRPGVFFFNTSTPEMWGPNLASTVFHEGIPGHHFQMALATEDESLHDLHRELFLPAFGEGWALYTERVADDMGLFTTDVDRLGMLANDALRACRLVVDTGLHAMGWTRQQAIDLMVDNSPLHRTEITSEVDRYIGMPGQATSYMMGRLEIERLRDESRARAGADFDLRAFHDTVLSSGMVSLPALRHLVESAAR